MSTARSNRGQRFPAEILTADEVKTLLGVCSSRAPTGVRNRALIATMYRGGLRISEVLALKLKDLDRKAGTVRLLNGKGKLTRTVGFDPTAFAMIERWLERRTERGIKRRAPIFCTLDGKPLEKAYVRALLRHLADKADIKKRVHAHALRHTHTAEFAREGVPIAVIQAQLGHANLGTLPDARGHEPRSAEGKPQCLEAWAVFC